MMGWTDLMLLEAIFPNKFSTVGLSQPKNGWKGNILWKNREFSLWSLLVLVSPGVQGAVMSKMMGRTYLMLLEAMYPNRFPTVGLFHPKHGWKGNFLWKSREFSLWSLLVLFWLDVQGAVMSKMMGQIDLMLLEAMYPNRFPTVGLFHPKNGWKGNFVWKKRKFSLRSLLVHVSPGVQGAVLSKIMGRTDLMPLEAMHPNRFSNVGLFLSKNSRKGNFLGKNRESSLWSLRLFFRRLYRVV